MKQFVVSLIVLMSALYVITKLFFVLVIPEKDFVLLPLIPIFFTVYGLLALKYVYIKKDISVSLLLTVKMMKTLLSLVFIVIYLLFKGSNPVAFLISYLVFFVSYLVTETIVLTIINKKRTTV